MTNNGVHRIDLNAPHLQKMENGGVHRIDLSTLYIPRRGEYLDFETAVNKYIQDRSCVTGVVGFPVKHDRQDSISQLSNVEIDHLKDDVTTIIEYQKRWEKVEVSPVASVRGRGPLIERRVRHTNPEEALYVRLLHTDMIRLETHAEALIGLGVTHHVPLSVRLKII